MKGLIIVKAIGFLRDACHDRAGDSPAAAGWARLSLIAP